MNVAAYPEAAQAIYCNSRPASDLIKICRVMSAIALTVFGSIAIHGGVLTTPILSYSVIGIGGGKFLLDACHLSQENRLIQATYAVSNLALIALGILGSYGLCSTFSFGTLVLNAALIPPVIGLIIGGVIACKKQMRAQIEQEALRRAQLEENERVARELQDEEDRRFDLQRRMIIVEVEANPLLQALWDMRRGRNGNAEEVINLAALGLLPLPVAPVAAHQPQPQRPPEQEERWTGIVTQYNQEMQADRRRRNRSKIDAGKAFIRKYVKPAIKTKKSRDEWDSSDPQVMEFIVCKAIYEYSYGTRKNEQRLPDFLENALKDKIKHLQNQQFNIQTYAIQLNLCFDTYEEFHKALETKGYNLYVCTFCKELRKGVKWDTTQLVRDCYGEIIGEENAGRR